MKKTSLIIVLFASTVSLFGAFKMKDDALTVKSSALELQMEYGMITSLRTASGDQLTQNGALLPDSPFRLSLVPNVDAKPTFKKINSKEARLSYPMEKNGKIYYDFKIDGRDILVRVGVENYDISKSAYNIDIHVPALTPDAIITGIGSKTLRKEPARTESLYWTGSAFHFPRVLIAEWKDKVLMFHNESTQPYHNIFMYHTPESDHVKLTGAYNYTVKKSDRQLIFKKGTYVSDYFRISLHKDWLAAAKYWRKDFERRTGAKKLWENDSKLIRNIHAVYTGSPNLGWKEDPDAYYKKIASQYDPASVILFYWNAHAILSLGDHTYNTKPYPSREAVAALRKYGFNWMSFHGYTLLDNKDFLPKRHATYIRNKTMPKGYKFTPDYQGKPEDFYKKMDPYFIRRGQSLGMVNPAAKYVEDYLVQNITNYSKCHDMAGFYLDITGEMPSCLRPGKRVYEGKTYTDGDIAVFRRLRKINPDLLMMTEYTGEWLIPYIFYAWEAEHIFNMKSVRINHPLRAALFGSYIWVRETQRIDDPIKNAYYATLPEIVDDFGTAGLEGALVSPWYNERAKLFCREKLFNDLPEKWDDEAIAYYRSAKNGFFQFRKMPFGHAYVDAKKNVLLGLYSKVSKGLPGFYVPDWVAYDAKGRAIGLNPAHTYKFMKTALPRNFTITALSDGAYLNLIRKSRSKKLDYSTIEIASDKLKTSVLNIKFHESPYKVLINGKEQTVVNKELKTNVSLPAAVVIYMKKLNEYPASAMGQRKGWISGFTGPNGLFRPHGYRGFYANFNFFPGKYTFGKVTKESMTVAVGAHCGYLEKQIQVPAEAKTLSFSLGLKQTARKSIPMVVTLRANGNVIWTTQINSKDVWQPQTVDISRYAGQNVLFSYTFQYQNADKAPIQQNCNNYLRIADFEIK